MSFSDGAPWINLKLDQSDKWVWQDTGYEMGVSSTHWAPGEPYGGNDCGYIDVDDNGDYKLSTDACSVEDTVICFLPDESGKVTNS